MGEERAVARGREAEGDPVVRLLAESLGLPATEVAGFDDATPLFGPPLGLGSLSGARLLGRILEETGVDVATLDLNLDSLASIGALRAFVAANR